MALAVSAALRNYGCVLKLSQLKTCQQHAKQKQDLMAVFALRVKQPKHPLTELWEWGIPVQLHTIIVKQHKTVNCIKNADTWGQGDGSVGKSTCSASTRT